jgi:hypothetical protein
MKRKEKPGSTEVVTTAQVLCRPALDRAYEHVLCHIQRDAAVLEHLRTRTNFVLSGTVIVASLFGSKVFEGQNPISLGIPALAVAALGLFYCIMVLLPVAENTERKRIFNRKQLSWRVTVNFDCFAHQSTEDEVDKAIVSELGNAHRQNADTLDTLSWRFEVACGLLLLQLTLWAIEFLIVMLS